MRTILIYAYNQLQPYTAILEWFVRFQSPAAK
jgi:hypothetical protein